MTTTRKTAKCPNCLPDQAGAIFYSETVYDEDFRVTGREWVCQNCGHTMPHRTRRQDWTFVTETATSVEQVRSLRNKVAFTYFNPNGAYAVKQATDDKISAAVDAGRCKSGALFVHGSLNDYHERAMRRLSKVKRPARFDVHYMIDGLLEEAARAEEFLAGLEN